MPAFPYEISFQLTELNGNGLTIMLNSARTVYLESKANGYWSLWGTEEGRINLNHTIKLKIYSNKIELYDEDTLLGTKNTTLSNPIIQLETGANRYTRLKNLKIKQL